MDLSSKTHPNTLPDWSNLDVIHRNTLAPRSNFLLYSNACDAISYDRFLGKLLSLSGTWQFKLFDSPFETPDDFPNSAISTRSWEKILVPGMWQLQGHGKGPQYTNVQYPFPIDPPHVPYFGNETGCYARQFLVPKEFTGGQLRLRFEGVDSAFYVWVNGKEVGYSQGARNPSEFDITSFVDLEGENRIAVKVIQFSDGSYIEDQDQWWLSGIFRDVFLLHFPTNHFEDIDIQTKFDNQYVDAVLSVRLMLTGKGNLILKLLDFEKNVIEQKSHSFGGDDGEIISAEIKFDVKSPRQWTAETPNLYHLLLSIDEASYIAQRVGFREIRMEDGLLLINGKRVVFRGVNRHEHHWLYGRAVPYESLRRDLILMKRSNINAIRTSHQPSDVRLYDLADELGFWVMDEADLECHGFEKIGDAQLTVQQHLELSFPQKKRITVTGSKAWASDNLMWRKAYLDRAQQLVHRDKLHPCVIIWSLGNESFIGCNLEAMTDWIKYQDPTRPVHYEGDLAANFVDMYSLMYPEIEELIELGEATHYPKPLVLCEFAHAMGNGPGGIKEYIDAFYKHPRLQGGFVWEWANHGLLTSNKSGKSYYGMGGDFGDVPNDGRYVFDGLLHSNHTPTPGLAEYCKAIEPVQVVGFSGNKVEIINRYDFDCLDHLTCRWELVSEAGRKHGGQVTVPEGVRSGQTARIEVPLPEMSRKREEFLNLTFSLKKATVWADAGHELAWAELPLPVTPSLAVENSVGEQRVTVDSRNQQPHIKILTAKDTSWTFDTRQGILTSYKKRGRELFSSAPLPNFWRPLTDNDRGQDGRDWIDRFLPMAKPYVRNVTMSHDSPQTVITATVKMRYAPPVLSWSIDCTLIYSFSSDGTVSIEVVGTPQGANIPKTLPRIGLDLTLQKQFDVVSWFGRGPGESYRDKKLSQRVGLWSRNVDELFTDYDFPQENGNRTDTRWVEFSNGAPNGRQNISLQASFSERNGARTTFDFQASHYLAADIGIASHPYELEKKKRDDIMVRLDMAHHGLGSGACGPKTYEIYTLKPTSFCFVVNFR